MRLFAGRKAAKKRGVGGLIGWIVGSDGSAMQVPGYTRLIDCPEVAAAVDASRRQRLQHDNPSNGKHQGGRRARA